MGTRTRAAAVVAGVGAALAAGLVAPPSAAGGSVKVVQVRDDCDPASFNAVLGQGTCVEGLGGDTTFQELSAALTGEKGARAMREGRLLDWRNNAVDTSLDRGEGMLAVSDGGELHTFSRVASLGGGCVDPLNDALGLPRVGEPGNNCQTTPPEHLHLLPAGEEVPIPASELTRGTNRYQCLIHPWMHTTVHVR